MKVMNNFFLLCQEASFGAVSGVVSALNILEIINIKKDGSNLIHGFNKKYSRY